MQLNKGKAASAVFAVGVALLLLAELRAADNEKQQEAAALNTRAAEMTNIRCFNCPSFVLRARLRVIASKHQKQEGTYTLSWLSPIRWREEIELGAFRQVRVVHGGKIWQQRTENSPPAWAELLDEALELPSRLRLEPQPKVKKIREKKEKGVQMRCVEQVGDTVRPTGLCFDPATEAPLSQEYTHRAFEYSDHQAFGAKLFPKAWDAFEEGKLALEVRVEELSTVKNFAKTLLDPLTGESVRAYCHLGTPPQLLNRSYPSIPPRVLQRTILKLVTVCALIGTDGLLHDITILRSGGPEIDRLFVDTLKTWKYKPRVCDGKPFEEETILHFPL